MPLNATNFCKIVAEYLLNIDTLKYKFARSQWHILENTQNIFLKISLIICRFAESWNSN